MTSATTSMALTAFSPPPILTKIPSLILSAPPLSISIPSLKTTVAATTYLIGANTLYLARRSKLRKMSMAKLWKIRTTREPSVSISFYLTIILAWQLFVLLFPLAETAARSFSQVSFFYSYPNANGCGIILEPRSVQHLNQSQRAKHQIRLDWHRFSVNVGNVGRDGFRHPPAVKRNLPHLDVPRLGLKHWPWRRRYASTIASNSQNCSTDSSTNSNRRKKFTDNVEKRN